MLGTGAIGSAVARVLLDHDHSVTVWNRSPARAQPLVAQGASLADGVAAVDADLLLVCVTDGQAAAEVLAALPERPGTVVSLLTATPEDAARLAGLAAERGGGFLAAGVQTAPDAIGAAGATFLYAGDADTFQRHRAVLELLGTARWVGDSPRAAAVWDQALFGAWYDAQLGLLRALDLVRAAGGDVEEFADAVARQLSAVVDGVAATASEVRRGEAPRGPASLAEHLPLLRDLAAARRGTTLGDGGLSEVADMVAGLVDRGRVDAGLSAVVAR